MKQIQNQVLDLEKEMEQEKQSKFKSIMIQIYLKIKMFFELMFKVEIKRCLVPLVLASLFFVSCTPQRRIERIAEKYNVYTFDTTIINSDTINISVPQLAILHDTIINVVQKNAVTTIQVLHDTIYIHTITTPKQVITKNINIESSKANRKCIVCCVCFALLFFLCLALKIYELWQQKRK